MPRQLRTKQRQ